MPHYERRLRRGAVVSRQGPDKRDTRQHARVHLDRKILHHLQLATARVVGCVTLAEH